MTCTTGTLALFVVYIGVLCSACYTAAMAAACFMAFSGQDMFRPHLTTDVSCAPFGSHFDGHKPCNGLGIMLSAKGGYACGWLWQAAHSLEACLTLGVLP